MEELEKYHVIADIKDTSPYFTDEFDSALRIADKFTAISGLPMAIFQKVATLHKTEEEVVIKRVQDHKRTGLKMCSMSSVTYIADPSTHTLREAITEASTEQERLGLDMVDVCYNGFMATITENNTVEDIDQMIQEAEQYLKQQGNV